MMLLIKRVQNIVVNGENVTYQHILFKQQNLRSFNLLVCLVKGLKIACEGGGGLTRLPHVVNCQSATCNDPKSWL